MPLISWPTVTGSTDPPSPMSQPAAAAAAARGRSARGGLGGELHRRHLIWAERIEQEARARRRWRHHWSELVAAQQPAEAAARAQSCPPARRGPADSSRCGQGRAGGARRTEPTPPRPPPPPAPRTSAGVIGWNVRPDHRLEPFDKRYRKRRVIT